MNRIAYLDGLRAVAVLAVVAYHTAQLNTAAPISGLGDILIRQGCHGVELFFIVSGFCLSFPLLARMHAEGRADFDVGRFAARRIVRIVPPYYIAIAVLWGFALVVQRMHFPFPPSIITGSTQPLQVLKQAAFADAHTRFLNTSFWTLPVELRWYVAFPVALWLWTRSSRAFFVVMVAAILAYATRAGSVDLLVLPAFMLGIVAAHVYVHEPRGARLAPLALVPVALIVMMQTPRHEWGFISPFSEAAAFLVVVTAGAVPFARALLSTGFFAFVGRASYSIYLVHSPLIGVMEERGIAPGVAAILSVCAGLVFWWLAERPFVETKLRDRLISEFAFVGRWLQLAGVGTGFRAVSRRSETSAEIAA